MQDALAHLDSRGPRMSNVGEFSGADPHFRLFPESFGTDRGRVRIKVQLSFRPSMLYLCQACFGGT